MTTRKPTQQEIAAYVRNQQAQQSTGAAQYTDSRLREQERLNSNINARAHKAAMQRVHEERIDAMHKAREWEQAEIAKREKQREAELEKELEPVKEKAWLEFQSEHPELSRSVFEKKRWPFLKEQMTSREARIAAEKQALLRSGRYNF